MKQSRKYKKAIENNDFETANKVVLENSDLVLYKYHSSFEYVIDAISNQRIYLSEANKFNDPYDSLIAIPDYSSNDNDIEVRLKEAYDKRTILESRKRLQSKVRVACFSETISSAVMWSHYANNHFGYCLAYRVSDLINSHEFLYPVVYSNSRYQPA